MNLKKTGAFLSSLRKEQGLTQSELAEKLGVTDKAVSRWETGRGFPDVAILPVLAKALQVSVAELVNGERDTGEPSQRQGDSKALKVFSYYGRLTRQIGGTLLLLLGIGVTACPLFLGVSSSLAAITPWGVFLMLLGIVLLSRRVAAKLTGFPQKSLRILVLGAAGLALLLEALPWSVTMRFSNGPGKYVTESFSYFGLLPVGYGVFPPLLAGLLTLAACACCVVSQLQRKRRSGVENGGFLCTVAATALCFAYPILYGVSVWNLLGSLISILLTASSVLQVLVNRA